VVECLDTLSSLLARIRPAAGEFTSIENIERRVADAGPAGDDETSRRLRAIVFLSLAGEPLVRDHFARSTAVGSLMRRQLAPLLDPVCRELAIAAAGQVVPWRSPRPRPALTAAPAPPSCGDATAGSSGRWHTHPRP